MVRGMGEASELDYSIRGILLKSQGTEDKECVCTFCQECGKGVSLGCGRRLGRDRPFLGTFLCEWALDLSPTEQ